MRTLTTWLIAGVLASTANISSAAQVMLNDAYARAVPPTQSNSAIFVSLHNHADTTVNLIGASSHASKHVELHGHTHVDGVMQMRKVDSITLPPQQAVSLKPGGLHIMLIDLEKPLIAGDTIDLTLDFDDGTQQQAQIPVESIDPMMHQHQH